MSSGEDSYVELSRDLVVKSCGFSADIGSTNTKLMYRALEDRAYNNDSKNAIGKLRVKLFPKGTDIVKFLQENADISKCGTCYATGVGGDSIRQQVESTFKLEYKTLLEHDCFARGLLLQNTIADSIIRPSLGEAAAALTKNMGESMKTYDSKNKADMEAVISNGEGGVEGMFPCLLALCGSGTLFIKVSEDGSQHIIDGSPVGGRTFVSLAQQLVNVRDFDELMEMAKRGKTENVDIRVCDNKKEEMFKGAYSHLPDDMTLNSFAKPASGGTYAPDDIVASLLDMWCSNLAHTSHLTSLLSGVHKVYYSGSFVQNDHIRTLISNYFNKRNMFSKRIRKPEVDFGFIKNGRYLGSLGCFYSKE